MKAAFEDSAAGSNLIVFLVTGAMSFYRLFSNKLYPVLAWVVQALSPVLLRIHSSVAGYISSLLTAVICNRALESGGVPQPPLGSKLSNYFFNFSPGDASSYNLRAWSSSKAVCNSLADASRPSPTTPLDIVVQSGAYGLALMLPEESGAVTILRFLFLLTPYKKAVFAIEFGYTVICVSYICWRILIRLVQLFLWVFENAYPVSHANASETPKLQSVATSKGRPNQVGPLEPKNQPSVRSSVPPPFDPLRHLKEELKLGDIAKIVGHQRIGRGYHLSVSHHDNGNEILSAPASLLLRTNHEMVIAYAAEHRLECMVHNDPGITVA